MKGLPLPAQYSPRTIPGLLAERATSHPEATAAFGKGADGYAAVSFAELADDTRRLAGYLVEYGVVPGDRVAWLIDNTRGLDALRLFHAVVWAGGVNVPINTRLAAPEVADIVRRSDSRLLFADPERLNRAATCLDLAWVVLLDDVGPASAPPAEPVDATDLTIASILFTSGTTGRPKGVVHTHGSSIAAAIGWSTALGLGQGDVLQSPFPIFSGAGLHFNGLSCLWAASEFVIDDYDTAASLELANTRESTVYVAVPSIYGYWLDSPALNPTALASLRALDYGGAAMAPALIEGLRERLPDVGLVQTYGLTEAGPGGTYLPAEDALARLGSIGRRCAGEFTELRVVDADGHDVVGTDEMGELLLRGPAVMDGYLDDQEATDNAFEDGWLRSGDIVRRDADGYLYVVDRKKDIIVRGGFNISSAEVEAALLAHPDILDAAVVGVPHPRLGEDVHAFIVLRRDASLDPTQASSFASEHIADFKVPRSYTFVDTLPRNAAGKVLKRQLRDSLVRSVERTSHVC